MDAKFTYDRSLIELIIPHRPPFLMVDSVTFYKSGKSPVMHANFMVKENEPLCSGKGANPHWPSIYIIEGLGQCCNLMIVISALEKELIKAGAKFNSMNEVLMGLMDDEPGEATASLKEILQKRLMEIYSSVGFLGSADMDITGYARQGQVVSYEVQQNQALGALYHSSVKAYTDENLIARGTMVSAGRKG